MEEIKNYSIAFCMGVRDSFRGFYTIFVLDRELQRRQQFRISPTHSSSPVRRRNSDLRETTPVKSSEKEDKNFGKTVIRGAAYNLLFMLSMILVFDNIIGPIMNSLFSYAGNLIGIEKLYLWNSIRWSLVSGLQLLYMFPLYVILKVFNGLWWQDVGQIAYKYNRGRALNSLSLSKTIADFFFNMAVEFLFFTQAILFTYIPRYHIGYILYLIHLCLLNSLYAFEYKWAEMGIIIVQRLTAIERQWPYFMGFGLPLALIAEVSSSAAVNSAIYSILFPIYIISAYEANPRMEKCKHIHFFSPVVSLSNMGFNLLIRYRNSIMKRAPAQHRR